MRIAVVGHLVHDLIAFPGMPSVSAPGGIAYNIAALCSLMAQGHGARDSEPEGRRESIMPVCEIGKDIRDAVLEKFGAFPQFDSSLIRFTKESTIVNRLVYDAEGNRQEWNSRRPRPIALDLMPKDIDALLLNFISGNDVALEELKAFRRRHSGLILCDFHSLALGRDRTGKRYYRRHPRWRQFVAATDIIQMNEAELRTVARPSSHRPHDIYLACGVIHSAGPMIVIITLGSSGLVLSIENGRQGYFIPAIKIPHEVDSTGCGDTLAAALLYYYLKSGDIAESACLGNRYAAAKALFSGIDGFFKIEQFLQQVGPPADPVRL